MHLHSDGRRTRGLQISDLAIVPDGLGCPTAGSGPSDPLCVAGALCVQAILRRIRTCLPLSGGHPGSEAIMNQHATQYELPIDSDEARRLLYGVVMICDTGDEWYDYDDDANVLTPTPPASGHSADSK